MTPEQIERLRRLLQDHVSLPDWPNVDALCDMALKVANHDVVLVPREPTPVMLSAGEGRERCNGTARDIYRAMVNAAMKEPKA